MTTPATYLHFDSTYRSRQEYPSPADFSIPVEGVSNYFNSSLNRLGSKDSVAGGAIATGDGGALKWSSNAFKLYSVAEPRDDPTWNDNSTGATLSIPTSNDAIGKGVGGTILLFGPHADVRPQFTKNYYKAARMRYTLGGTDYTCICTDYEYIDDGLCQFTVADIVPNITIPAGTVFTIDDPTDIAAGKIFVPGGYNWDNAYTSEYIVFNDTINQWRPIDSYEGQTHMLEIYQGPPKQAYPQDGTSTTSGPCVDWTAKHTYSVRHMFNKLVPSFNTNGGSALSAPSPTNTTNNTAMWFEPKQSLVASSFNFGKNVNLKDLVGAWLEFTPDPGGTTPETTVNYEDTLTGGTTTTAIMTVGPNAFWTQEDFYSGMSMVITSTPLVITQNTGAASKFPPAQSWTVEVDDATKATYAGAGTGMILTITLQVVNLDEVVSANIVDPGSGYVAGETITITEAQMRTITATPGLTMATSVILTLTSSLANLHQVRTIKTYEADTKTLIWEPALSGSVASGDTIGIYTFAENEILSGKIPSRYPRPSWRNEPLIETGQITSYINRIGTFAAAGTAGATSLTLTSSNWTTEEKRSNALNGFWISWVQNGGCYARLIETSSYANNVMTITFKRALGGVISTAVGGIVLTATPGTGYAAPTLGVTTTVAPIGGSGLTVDINAVGGGGAVTGVSVNAPGNHYSVGDIITVSGSGNGDCELLVAILEDIPQGTDWYIRSGKIARVSQASQQSGLSTYMNMQQWLLLQYTRNHAKNFVLTSSRISHQQAVCYEIELITLILPNAKLNVGAGGRLAYYPYVFVQLEAQGTSSGTGPHTITSNNPFAEEAMFIASIDDVNHPNTSTFLKIDGDGMVQTVKFNPEATLRFKVFLPNGQTLSYIEPDTAPPSPPNPLSQISAVFQMKRIG